MREIPRERERWIKIEWVRESEVREREGGEREERERERERPTTMDAGFNFTQSEQCWRHVTSASHKPEVIGTTSLPQNQGRPRIY